MSPADQDRPAAERGPSVSDEATMWVDLLESHLHAESARFRVTRRAEVYLHAAGLPLDRVLDALRTDEAGWAARVAQLRDQERANRSAADRLEAARCSCRECRS